MMYSFLKIHASLLLKYIEMIADVGKKHTVYLLEQSSILYKLRNVEVYFEKLWLLDNVALRNSNSEFCVIFVWKDFHKFSTLSIITA